MARTSRDEPCPRRSVSQALEEELAAYHRWSLALERLHEAEAAFLAARDGGRPAGVLDELNERILECDRAEAGALSLWGQAQANVLQAAPDTTEEAAALLRFAARMQADESLAPLLSPTLVTVAAYIAPRVAPVAGEAWPRPGLATA